MCPIFILFIHRITVRWNQTGQKYAGADDIAKWFSFTDATRQFFFLLLCITFVALSATLAISFWKLNTDTPSNSSIFVHTCFLSSVCGLVALVMGFKLRFTAEDAPELLVERCRELIGIFFPMGLVDQAPVSYTH